MRKHDTYILHIWHNRALGGWQWVARVERLSDGQRLRFANPEALLDHLQEILQETPIAFEPEEHGGETAQPGPTATTPTDA